MRRLGDQKGKQKVPKFIRRNFIPNCALFLVCLFSPHLCKKTLLASGSEYKTARCVIGKL